jgi:hypothetical protein
LYYTKRLEQTNNKNPSIRASALIKEGTVIHHGTIPQLSNYGNSQARPCTVAGSIHDRRIDISRHVDQLGASFTFKPVLHDPQSSTELSMVRSKIAG